MEELTLKLLRMSLHGAVLILAAALLRRILLRFLPKGILRLLWAPVLLALLVPLPEWISVSVPLPAAIWSQPRQEEPAQIAAPDAAEDRMIQAQAGMDRRDPGREGAGAARQSAKRLSPLALIWLAGAGATGLAFLCLYLGEYARLRRALPLRGEKAEAWLRDHPLRRPLALRVLPELHSPMTYGVFRPVILLPEAPDWDAPQTRFVLEHEFVHVRHIDAAWKLLMNLTLTVHWFDPAVWLMSRLFDRDMELSCDETVLLRLGDRRREEFARMLLENVRRRSLTPFPGMGAGVLRERVYHIMSFRGGSVFRRCLALTLVLLLTLGTFCSLRVGAADERLYRNGDVTLSVPSEVAELLLVETPELTGKPEEVLFRVYERESVEAAKERYPDSRRAYGLLFTILRMDEETAGKSMRRSIGTRSMLARDAGGYYYLLSRAAAEDNLLTPSGTEDMDARWERRKLVNQWVRELRDHLRWELPLRTRYPAYSGSVASWFACILYGTGRGYRVSFGDEGHYVLHEAPGMERFAQRLTWELASESAHLFAIPQEEPLVLTRPTLDRELWFWEGSDLVLLCSGSGAQDSVRYYYRVRFLDSPEEKAGDLVKEWYEAARTAAGE